tara:strand:- start:19646 stop:21916 length:2271 start_codon:yes stop_codon:yes gene_type:complete
MANRSDQTPGLMRYGADDVARFRDYADAEADWFWELDPNFHFTIVSCRHEGRSSIRENDLLGKTLWAFADADPDSDPVWADFVGRLKRRVAFREFRICVRVDGEAPLYWRLSGKPVVGDDGTFFGYRGIATDETVEALRRGQLEALAADYQSVLQGFGAGVAYFNSRARLAFTNTQFRDLMPVRAESLKLESKFTDVIAAIADVLRPGTPVAMLPNVPARQTVTWTRKDGTEVLCEIRPLPSGGHALIVSALQPMDIPGMAKFHGLMKSSLQAFITHVEGRIVFANSAAADIFGSTPSEMLELTVWDFMSPSEVPRLKAYGHARMEGDPAPERYQVQARRLDGTPMELEFLVCTENSEGRRAFHVFVQDRTNEHQAQRLLAHSERKFRDLVEGSIQGLFVHRDWKIIYANAAAATIFGYDSVNFEEADVRDLVSTDDIGLIEDMRNRRIAGDVNVPERYELQGVRADGSQIWVELFSRVVEWDGAPAIQTTIMDITQRKKIEGSLINAKDRAEHADRAKTEFLGNMSHELRTPLNAVIGFSQLIRDQIMGEISPQYIDYAASIHTSGQHLLEVVNDLLDVASIESGSMALHEEPVDLSEIARTCERMLRGRALRASLLISVERPDTPVRVTADARRLKQVFINLVGNAIKFTEQGGSIIIRVEALDDGCARMSVVDTGIGIPKEHQKDVFDAFFRVDSSFVSKREGTGLGLPLVRALSDLHQAEIGLESDVGVGTTVSLTFPEARTCHDSDGESDS